MAYVVLADLQGRIPSEYLTEGLDDAGTGEADAMDAVVDDADRAVNAILGLRFTVPFESPYPPIVIEAARTFACELIYRRRGVSDEQNPWVKTASDLRSMLAKIAGGTLPLSPTIARTKPSATLIKEAAGTYDSGGRRLT